MKDILAIVKGKLVKPDGTLNGKILSGLISLTIVLIQQLCVVFGFHLKGDVASTVAIANTLLTLLGVLGVLSDPTPVVIDGEKKAEK